MYFPNLSLIANSKNTQTYFSGRWVEICPKQCNIFQFVSLLAFPLEKGSFLWKKLETYELIHTVCVLKVIGKFDDACYN